MNVKHLTSGVGLAVWLTCLPGAMTAAAEPPAAAPWTWSASPYLWAAGLSGDFGQLGLPTTHLDQRFSDVLKDLDLSVMLIAEGRRGRYTVFGDVQYTRTSSGADLPGTLLPSSSVTLTSKTFSGLFGGGYAIYQDPRTTLDLVGGARIWHASTRVAFNGGFSARDSATWVDAMVGLKARHALGERFYVSGWALAGTGQARFDWDLAALVGYDINDTFSAVAGYRALGVDYRRHGFVFDAVQKGPVLGVVLRF